MVAPLDPTANYRPNDDEAKVAAVVARIRRSFDSKKTNLAKGETECDRDRFINDYAAALAEIAVARYTNMCWTACGNGGNGRLADVGGVIEVRSIRDRHKGLLANKADRSSAPYCLVYVNPVSRVCTMLGWEFLGTVRDKGKVYNELSAQPYHILPQALLRPMHELVPTVAGCWVWRVEYETEEKRIYG